MKADYWMIKERFHALVGNLSIEEVVSNHALVKQIETLSGLLARLTS